MHVHTRRNAFCIPCSGSKFQLCKVNEFHCVVCPHFNLILIARSKLCFLCYIPIYTHAYFKLAFSLAHLSLTSCQ